MVDAELLDSYEQEKCDRKRSDTPGREAGPFGIPGERHVDRHGREEEQDPTAPLEQEGSRSVQPRPQKETEGDPAVEPRAAMADREGLAPEVKAALGDLMTEGVEDRVQKGSAEKTEVRGQRGCEEA